jgi:hypothetical protein
MDIENRSARSDIALAVGHPDRAKLLAQLPMDSFLHRRREA